MRPTSNIVTPITTATITIIITDATEILRQKTLNLYFNMAEINLFTTDVYYSKGLVLLNFQFNVVSKIMIFIPYGNDILPITNCDDDPVMRNGLHLN